MGRRKFSDACMRDANWVLSFGEGSAWSADTGFRPNRQAELIALGVLVPAEGGGYTVGTLRVPVPTPTTMKGLIAATVKIIEQLSEESNAELRRCMSYGVGIIDMNTLWYSEPLIDRLTPEGMSWLRETYDYAQTLLRAQEMALEPGDTVEYTPYGSEPGTRVQVRLTGRSPYGSINVFTIPVTDNARRGLLNVTEANIGLKLIRRGTDRPNG